MAGFTRSAILSWSGDVTSGSGTVSAGTKAFQARVSFPRIAGDPDEVTTPEELLAAAHASCFGIGLRSMIGRKGGRADRISVVATITAERGHKGIRVLSAHLSGRIEGLVDIAVDELKTLARETAAGCTISEALRGNVYITHEVTATRGDV